MKQTILRILRYCRPYRRYLVLTMLCTLLSVSLSLLVPILIGEAVDCAVSAGRVDFDGLARIAVILAISVLVSGAFQWIAGLLINRLAFFSELIHMGVNEELTLTYHKNTVEYSFNI